MSKRQINPEIVKGIEEALNASDNLTTDSTIYNDNLPEGHTAKTVKELVDYTSEFVAASVKAIGNIAAKKLAEDKDADRVTGTVGMGHMGSTSTTAFREKTVTIPSPVKGESPTQRVDVGAVRHSVTFKGGANSVFLKQAKTEAQQLIEEALK